MTTKPDSIPVIVTDQTFTQLLNNSLLPVLLDMWAPWNQASLDLAPVLDQIASELAGKIKVAKLNIDENPNSAVEFGVRSIPTIFIFKDGIAIERLPGPQSKSAILDKLKAVMG